MIVVASANGRVGIKAAIEVMKKGGSPIDAVEAGIRLVESNLEDHSVGKGGLPNLAGEVELDASIMDGDTLAAGAVGAVHGFEHPISIARRVMEELPHVFLVGPGAERFAKEMGFEPTDLLTPEAKEIWARGFVDSDFYSAPERVRYLERMRKLAAMAKDPEKAHGTVNFIALDDHGHMACGVSTSGWAWKYPGRLGDSPVIGAGNYCDSRYGGAACTGRGEMAIRAATAHSVVMYLKAGLGIQEAGIRAMNDLEDLVDEYFGGMNIVALDRHGEPAAFSDNPNATFVYMTGDMDEPVEKPRTYVELKPTRR